MGIHNPAHPGEILKGLALDPLARIIHDDSSRNR
jgi:plasmid maintenance system antidote protein VapI